MEMRGCNFKTADHFRRSLCLRALYLRRNSEGLMTSTPEATNVECRDINGKILFYLHYHLEKVSKIQMDIANKKQHNVTSGFDPVSAI